MSKFALQRFPDELYDTELEVIAASNEKDAVLGSQKRIEERFEDGHTELVSVNDLKERLVEREIANETGEESVPPEPIREGEELPAPEVD